MPIEPLLRLADVGDGPLAAFVIRCLARVAGLSLGHGMLAGMLTDADLARIVAVVATKEDIGRVEERLAALEENLNRFVTASEKFTGAFQDLKLEYAAVSTQLSRHEEWIKKLAEKTDVTLQY